MQRVFLIPILLIIVIYTTSCGELNTIYIQACKDKSVSLINNEQDLNNMQPNGNYCLTTDLEIQTWKMKTVKDRRWTFKGEFNGDNKRITINTIQGNAFIEKIDTGGTFKNVTINIINKIEPKKDRIAVLTIINNGRIENVTIEGNKQEIGPPKTHSSIGGLVAENYGTIDNVRIKYITIKSSKKFNAGGLVGYNKGTIKNVELNYVKVEGNKNAVGLSLGGLVGTNDGNNARIDDVKLTNITVSGGGNNINSGGLVGVNFQGSIIKNAKVVSGSITAAGQGNVGGLVGQNEGTIEGSHANTTIKAARQGNVGGLVGYNNKGTIEGSHAVNTTIKAAGQGNVGGLVGKHEGTIEGSHASVNTTIDYSGTDVINAGGFIGLQDLAAKTSECYSAGSLTNEKANQANLGGFIGKLNEYNGESIIEKSFSTTDITYPGGDGINVGGFIGRQGAGTITKCYSAGKLESTATAAAGSGGDTYVGGFIGQLSGSGTIEESFSTTDITYPGGDDIKVGGFIGRQGAGTIKNAYSAGKLESTATAAAGSGGNTYVGGFIGQKTSFGNIYYVYTRSTITPGDLETAGHFAGMAYGTIDKSYYIDTGLQVSVGVQNKTNWSGKLFLVGVQPNGNPDSGTSWALETTIWNITEGEWPTFKWQP